MMTMATGITIQDIAQTTNKCHPDNILQLINSLENAEFHIQALDYDGRGACQMEQKATKEEIKEFWDSRAKERGCSPAATTNDIYLRELEVSTIIQTLQEIDVPENAEVLDVGCGDGYSTTGVAQAAPGLSFFGIDYNESMIDIARKRLAFQPGLPGRVSFSVGDATDLGQSCGDSVYDIVLSVRCLINLASFENQCHAIAEIAKRIKPGGYYIAIENFVEGHENMNRARRAVGAPEISIGWFNSYFKEHEFLQSVERFFEDIEFKDFSSSYYFATRVVYSAMCTMREEEPDYHHEIHQLAVRLPWVGQFSPIRMVVMRKS